MHMSQILGMFMDYIVNFIIRIAEIESPGLYSTPWADRITILHNISYNRINVHNTRISGEQMRTGKQTFHQPAGRDFVIIGSEGYNFQTFFYVVCQGDTHIFNIDPQVFKTLRYRSETSSNRVL